MKNKPAPRWLQRTSLVTLLAVLCLGGCSTSQRGLPSPEADQQEIAAKIAGIREAILAKSAAGIVQSGTPDWQFTGPDGVSFDRAGFIVRTEALFARVVAIESLETHVDSIVPAGADVAEVEITQTMVRAERAAGTGGVARFLIRYREHHHWVRTPDGWRVQRVRFIGTPERTPLPAS